MVGFVWRLERDDHTPFRRRSLAFCDMQDARRRVRMEQDRRAKRLRITLRSIGISK
jgi:hypothetical protein